MNGTIGINWAVVWFSGGLSLLPSTTFLGKREPEMRTSFFFFFFFASKR